MTGRDHSMAPAGSAGLRRPRPLAALTQGGSAAALLIALMGTPLGQEAKAEGGTAISGAASPQRSAPDAQLSPGPVPDDVAALLPLLMTSPERKLFAAELEAAIRLGRLEDAERQLKIAIETGTLAIVLSDRLQEPSLLAALQSLDLKTETGKAETSEARSDRDAGRTVAETQPGPDIAELQAALEQEKAQSSAALQELSSVTAELHKAQQAREAEAASAAAAVAKASDLESALQQERERGDIRRQDLELELRNLRADFDALQAQRARAAGDHASTLAEAKAALAQERERSETATRELAMLKDEVGSLRAARNSDTGEATVKVAALEESLRRERERADAATNDLAEARKDASERQAIAARDAAADLASIRDALAQERSRADEVTRELADAIDAIRAAQEVRASGPAPLLFRLAADAAPLPVETRAETQSAAAPQPVLVAAVGTAPGFDRPASAPGAAETVASLPGPGQKGAPDTIQSRPTSITPAAPATTEDRLVRRADTLFQSGDVSGARLLLERAMEAGNAQAAFRLAETFDPNVLSRLGALGIRPDPAKARDLYARALALGIRQAGERMQALR